MQQSMGKIFLIDGFAYRIYDDYLPPRNLPTTLLVWSVAPTSVVTGLSTAATTSR